MDERLAQIEKLTRELEDEKDFDKVIEKFNAAATLIKKTLADNGREKGKITEIIKEIDGLIEKELDLCPDDE